MMSLFKIFLDTYTSNRLYYSWPEQHVDTLNIGSPLLFICCNTTDYLLKFYNNTLFFSFLKKIHSNFAQKCIIVALCLFEECHFFKKLLTAISLVSLKKSSKKSFLFFIIIVKRFSAFVGCNSKINLGNKRKVKIVCFFKRKKYS